MQAASDETLAIWNNYYRHVLSQPHRPSTEQAEKLNTSGNLSAIDCGCGTGNDIGFLIAKGYQVSAFDNRQEAIDICNEKYSHLDTVALKKCEFEDFTYPPAGLVIANDSLYFSDPDHFDETWKKIDNAIVIGGIFCGDFLGKNDSWVKNPFTTINPLSRKKVESLFVNYQIEQLTERDAEGKTATGKIKHWHTYKVIARKTR